MHKHSPSWFVLSSEATADIRCEVLIPAVVLTAMATCIIILRWYSRLCATSTGVKTEDYLVTIALIFSIGITAVIGGEFSIDGGKVDDESRYSSFSTMMKLVFAQSIMYHLSINLVKASFVLQYARLFALVPSMIYSCHTLLVLILGATAWGVFGVVFLCNPVQMYWNIAIPGTCIDAETHFWSTSIMGIVLDWAIWLLPIPVVGRLKLPRRQKMGLLVVFGFGGFVCIVSVLRLVLVHYFAHQNKVTKSGTYALVFSTIEVNVAIICASLFVMKPLLARFVPSVVSEQPLSAREVRRLWRNITGVDLLSAGLVGDEEKAEDDGRRDTAVSMERTLEIVAAPPHVRGHLRRSKSL